MVIYSYIPWGHISMSNKLAIGEILLNCNDEELLSILNENYPGMERLIISASKMK